MIFFWESVLSMSDRMTVSHKNKRISDDRFLHCCNRRPRTGTGMCPSQAFSSGCRPRPTGRSRSVHPRSEDPCTGHRACPGPHPGAPGQPGTGPFSARRGGRSVPPFLPRDRSRPPGSWSPTGGYTLPGPAAAQTRCGRSHICGRFPHIPRFLCWKY